MTPDEFKSPLIEEAYRLKRMVTARHTHAALDPKTSMWVIRLEAWREFMASADFFRHVQSGPDRRNELLGLPVRITVDDSDAAPAIQLVMEPLLAPKRGGGR